MGPKKFLFVTMPVTGHVSPLLPLAACLIERGHEVRWYTSGRFKSRIQTTGSKFMPYQSAVDIDYDKINHLFPERARLKGIAQAKYDMKHLVIDIAVEQSPDISAILDDYPADLITGDSFAYGAQFTAESRGIPYAVVNIMNIGYPSQDTGPDGLGLAPNSTWFGHLRNRALNWFLEKILMRDVNNHFSAARAKLGLGAGKVSVFTSPYLADIFLQPTIPDFEYPRSDLPDNVYFIGALIPKTSGDFSPPEWWHRLESSRPIVLITQGTVATNPEALLIPAIHGLAGEDVLIIATIGNLPSDTINLASWPKQLIMEPFIPFDRLMPHVNIMVTNGGYGGVHIALTHGVPLVAAGTSEDKAEICARIGWAGVGINLKTGTPTAEQVREAVQKVLRESQYVKNARAMQAKFAKCDGTLEGATLLENTANGKLNSGKFIARQR